MIPDWPRSASDTQRLWLWSAVACVVLVVFSYFVLDQPIATFVHEYFHNKKLFDIPTHIVDPFLPAAAFMLAIVGIANVVGWKLGGPDAENAVLRASLSLVAAIVIKDQLKIVFGRTWPETWTHHNPSFFDGGAYGFHAFHGGVGYAAFPSGHMTEVCTVMAVLWAAYPAFRWLYVTLAALVALGLIGADYHWLSDVIAGAFLGTAVGAIGARIGQATSGRSAR